MNLSRTIQFLIGAIVLLAVPSVIQAQISVQGGNQVLAITTGLPGSEPIAVTNVSAQVRFSRQNYIAKITVYTTCPGQHFNLTVVAVSPGDGVAAPVVTLQDGLPAADFITDIPAKPPGGNNTATLQYTASSTFAQGNSAELGDDVHTVTYTLTAQ